MSDWDGERCQNCQRPYAVVWAAENDLWNEVVGSSSGMLCPDCFSEKCSARGIYPFFVCHREHVALEGWYEPDGPTPLEKAEAEVDLLRAAGHEFFNTGDSTALGRALEGAQEDRQDELTRLRKQKEGLYAVIDRITAERNRLRKLTDYLRLNEVDIDEAERAFSDLQAQNERLRAELDAATGWGPGGGQR